MQQNNKKTNHSRKFIVYSGLKMLGVLFVTPLLLVGLLSVGSTISYFNDNETSIGNYLRADPLSFNVLVASSTSVQIDMSHGDFLVVPVMLPEEDSEPIQYFVMATTTEWNSALCNAINVLGTFPFPYDGSLLSLQTGTTTEIGSWALTFSLPNVSSFSNTSCTVDLVYKGWNADSPFGKGYNDSHTISLTFYVPDISTSLIISEISSNEVLVEISAESSTTPEADAGVVTEVDQGNNETSTTSDDVSPDSTVPPVDPVVETPVETTSETIIENTTSNTSPVIEIPITSALDSVTPSSPVPENTKSTDSTPTTTE